MELERLKVTVETNLKDFNTKMNSMKKQMGYFKKSADDMSKGVQKSTSGISKAIKGIAISVGIAKLASFSKSCLDLASDLQESTNLVNTVFPNMSKQIEDFSKSAYKSAGLSETMAKKYLGNFGTMAEQFGFTESEAYKMGTALTQLTGDVSSFRNISQDEAYTKLKSVFSGETESLKELGVVMTENALNQYAMANGINKTVDSMTEQEKVALRTRFVMDKLSMANGDFVRTSDSWANQVRMLSLQFDSLKANLGAGFIIVLTPVIKMLNALLERLVALSNGFKTLIQSLFGISAGGNNAPPLSDSLGLGDMSKSLGGVNKGVNGLGNGLKKAGKEAKKTAKEIGGLAKFDNVNTIKTTTADDDTDSGSDISSGLMGGLSDIPIGLNTSKADSQIAELSDRVKRLFEPFQEAWDNQGQNVIESLKYSFDSILQLVKDIGTSFEEVWTNGTGEQTCEYILSIFSQIVGAIGDISTGLDEAWTKNDNGTQIVQNIWDVINDILYIINDMGKAIESVWNEIGQSVCDHTIEAIKGISELLKHIGDKFKEIWDNGGRYCFEQIVEFGGRVYNILCDIVKDGLVPFGEFLADILTPVIETVRNIVGGIFDAVNDFLDMLDGSPVLQGLVDVILSISTAIIVVLGVLKAFDGILTFIEIVKNGIGVITTLFSMLCNPIGIVIAIVGALILVGYELYKHWDELCAFCSEIWESISNTFSSAWEYICELCSYAWESIKGFFQGFIDWFGEAFKNNWFSNFGILGGIFEGFLHTIDNIWNGIKKIFGGIIEFIKGVFTGNWEQAWNGVKNIFKGVFDTLVGIAKAPINAIIGFLNGMIGCLNKAIEGLNSLSIDVPSWIPGIGGKSFSLDIPTIPKVSYLAKGGIVDKATPCVVGEAGKEAVMPLENNTGWITQLANDIVQRGNIGGNNEAKFELTQPIYIGGEYLTTEVIRGIASIKKQTGVNPITTI